MLATIRRVERNWDKIDDKRTKLAPRKLSRKNRAARTTEELRAAANPKHNADAWDGLTELASIKSRKNER